VTELLMISQKFVVDLTDDGERNYVVVWSSNKLTI